MKPRTSSNIMVTLRIERECVIDGRSSSSSTKYEEKNPGPGAVNTKAYHGATREAPKTNGGIDVVGMVEGTAAVTPT
ncbi:hypothetical protein F2Q69_00054193 [Brassica cretica]|uniref:Uncharacterized protein n=1 Tax=Brassica cretica TaxID=69181 RepID=A0A8S9N0C9_BRACR|nr:hypothetical protein F2Q69_00054193 [Brassica cretica]